MVSHSLIPPRPIFHKDFFNINMLSSKEIPLQSPWSSAMPHVLSQHLILKDILLTKMFIHAPISVIFAIAIAPGIDQSSCHKYPFFSYTQAIQTSTTLIIRQLFSWRHKWSVTSQLIDLNEWSIYPSAFVQIYVHINMREKNPWHQNVVGRQLYNCVWYILMWLGSW